MVRSLYALFLLVLLIHQPLAAQLQSRFQVQQYSTDNGLPSNGIKGMAFDEKTGFLWIGTEAGVVRFNGRDFTVFSKSSLPGFSSERSLFLLRNEKGNIFFSDQNDHVFRIQSNIPAVFDPLHRDTGAMFSRQLSMAVSNISLGVNIRYPNDGANPFTFAKVVPYNDTTALVMRTNNELVYLTASSNTIHQIPLNNIRVQDLFKIQERCFILGNENQIFELADLTGRIIPIACNNREVVFRKSNAHSIRLYWASGMEAPLLFNGNNAWQFSIEGHTIIPELICDEIPENSFITYAQFSQPKGLFFLGTD